MNLHILIFLSLFASLINNCLFRRVKQSRKHAIKIIISFDKTYSSSGSLNFCKNIFCCRPKQTKKIAKLRRKILNVNPLVISINFQFYCAMFWTINKDFDFFFCIPPRTVNWRLIYCFCLPLLFWTFLSRLQLHLIWIYHSTVVSSERKTTDAAADCIRSFAISFSHSKHS